ncbi:acyltransferase [Flavobacterium sp. W1B]|uniref:acyltransferase n=1 Tax=Flavobacterium sp. W1B TaxID=3394146 RepID=UPI0039BC952D
MTQKQEKNRIPQLDILRVLATLMVITVHAGDIYMYDAKTMSFGTEASVIAVLLRSCVPLFIIMSSILLLPIKTDTTTFFKRRFSRVVIPFLIWSIIYVFLPIPNEIAFGGPSNAFTDLGMNVYLYNLMMIPINFTGSNVHFWFIYIILGLYLFMPIFSPWIKTATKKMLVFYLSLWGITLFLPYVHLLFPQIQGECDWNSFGMFYYFGGYFGYVILGYFLHHYNSLSITKSVAIGSILFIVGTIVTYIGFKSDQNAFLHKIISSNVEDWKLIEFNISFLAPSVVIMTAGVFMIFQKIQISGLIERLFKELSVLSYGIFLIHYILVLWIGNWMQDILIINAGIEQLLIALLTFLISYCIVKLISLIPKSKYIIG